MHCTNCETPRLFRSTRTTPTTRLMSWLGLFPWDCRDCGRLHWRRLDGHYQMAELPEHYQRIA